MEDLRLWSESADAFVEAMEAGLVGRLRAKFGAAQIAAKQEKEMERQVAAFESAAIRRRESETPEQTEERLARVSAIYDERFELMAELFDHEPLPSLASVLTRKGRGGGESEPGTA